MKKISLYVDETELTEFDSQLPKRGRSEVIRDLMQHYSKMRSAGNVEGIIIKKPTVEEDYFLVHLLNSYYAMKEVLVTHGIVKVPTEEIVKANLDVGNLVKLHTDSS